LSKGKPPILDSAGEIKIRALPRSNEKDEANNSPSKDKAAKPAKRWIIYVCTSALLIAAVGLLHKVKGPAKGAKGSVAKAKLGADGKIDLASINARINNSVTRHMQDAEIQTEMLRRTREIENEPYSNALANKDKDDESLPDVDSRNYGVQLEAESSAEKVFEDLNTNSLNYGDTLPGDKINARIANSKWLNELERAEKIQFISAFIRSAYDRGYEVEIDQNLVVIGVKKIRANKALDINQVIDRLAKSQGPG
jgi:hypothetical protein